MMHMYSMTKNTDGVGGYNSPVVVMKSDGTTKSVSQFMRTKKESDNGKVKSFNSKE